MRASDKIKVRQRRFAHVALILISFSLMFVGKADLVVLRDARMRCLHPYFLASGADQDVPKRFELFQATPGAKRDTAQWFLCY